MSWRGQLVGAGRAIALGLGVAVGAGAGEARPFAWRLGSGPSPSYLVGSVHVARDDVYPLPEPLDAAFAACDQLVVEADPDGMGPEEMQKWVARFAYYRDERRLQDAVDREAMGELAGIFARHHLSPARFERMKPWYVAQVVSVLELSRMGVDPRKGIDLHFLGKARGKKPIVELEGVPFQLMFLNHFSDREQQLMLEYTLRSLEQMEAVLDRIFDAWKSGDPDRLDRLMRELLKENPGLEQAFEKLMTGRNPPMARKIQKLLEGGGRHFIVVGAGHLVGEKGLLRLLADNGIAVERVRGEAAMAVGE